MSKISYPQLVKNLADAYRTTTGSTEPIVIGELVTKVTEAMNGCGVSVEYKSITYNEDNTITLIDKDNIVHTMSCVYQDGKIISLTYDGKNMSLTYDNDTLLSINNTNVNLAEAPVVNTDNGNNVGCSEQENALIERKLISFNNNSITEIGQYAFAGCSTLNNINAPNVTRIDAYAFKDCKDLSSFVVPDNLEYIGDDVFSGCLSFEEYITSENCVNYFADTDGVLYNKDKTKLIAIPNHYKGGYEFIVPDDVITLNKDCINDSLRYIVIPNTVTQINAQAFSKANDYIMLFVDAYSTAQDYATTNNLMFVVTSNREDAKKMSFQKHANFDYYEITNYSGSVMETTEVVCPDYIGKMDKYIIGDNCFDGFTKLTSVVVPNNIYRVDSYAFRNCGLTEFPVNFSNSYLYDYAFYGCLFDTLTLSNNNMYLGTGVFSNNKNLTTVYYNGTNSINASIFEECENLKHLVLSSTTQITIHETALTNTPISKGEGYIYVVDKKLSSYQSAYPNYNFRDITLYTVDGTASGILDTNKI